tara:strand:- start:301 stop:420 length:120 start_codon:yes stop_codon:yes gene_type:complete
MCDMGKQVSQERKKETFTSNEINKWKKEKLKLKNKKAHK